MPDITDATATSEGLWIATMSGLFTAPLDEPATEPATMTAEAGSADGDPGDGRAPARPLPPALDTPARADAGFWRDLLPRVTIVLARVDSQPGTSEPRSGSF